jgi:pimeloyl-ACP methyl ester carboxylesterase
MHYSDTGGSGPALLLLHGTGCDSADWDAAAGCLPVGLRVIRMDFRGHGASEVPRGPFVLADLASDALALLGHLGPERAIVVGHSLGGMAALDAAARSSRIAALVLLEGWTRLTAAGAFSGDRYYGRLPEAAIREIERKASETRLRFDRATWQHFWTSVERFDGLPYLRGARIPIAEAYGAMGRTESSERTLLVPESPNIELIWIADAGHFLPHERPGEVAAICARMIEKAG